MHSVSTFMILARISTWFNEIVKILCELSCGKRSLRGLLEQLGTCVFLGIARKASWRKYSLKVKPEG